MRRIYPVLIAVFLTGTAIAQQQVTALSLEQCMEYAARHNYSIRSAQIDVLIQEAQVKETVAAALPHINGKAEFDDYLSKQKTYFPTGTFGNLFTPLLSANPVLIPPPTITDAPAYSAIEISPRYNFTAGASLSQSVFDGSVLVALQARRTVIELARQNSEVTATTVRYNVFKAYNSLVIAYRQFNITKNALKYARSIDHDIQVTHQNGMAEKIDVQRSSVQINNLATDSMRISNILTVSEQILKFQIGMDINTPIALTDTGIEQRRDELLRLLAEEENYNRVPEYNLLQTQLKLNQYNVKRYELAALPSVNFIANGGYNYSSDAFSDFFKQKYLNSLLVGLQLNMPIFNGFLRVNQVREAKLNVDKSLNNIENIKFTIDFQSAQARTSVKNALLQAEAQRRNMDLSNDVLDLAQRKYKEGVGSNLEVTQAQTDLLRAQNNYFSSLLDLINAEADLKKALGLLNK